LNDIEIRTTLRAYPEYEELNTIKGGLNLRLEKLLLQSLNAGHIFLDICGETAFYVLEHVKECKEYLKEKYTHVFIDEYQDCGDI